MNDHQGDHVLHVPDRMPPMGDHLAKCYYLTQINRNYLLLTFKITFKHCNARFGSTLSSCL